MLWFNVNKFGSFLWKNIVCSYKKILSMIISSKSNISLLWDPWIKGKYSCEFLDYYTFSSLQVHLVFSHELASNSTCWNFEFINSYLLSLNNIGPSKFIMPKIYYFRRLNLWILFSLNFMLKMQSCIRTNIYGTKACYQGTFKTANALHIRNIHCESTAYALSFSTSNTRIYLLFRVHS